MNYSWDQGDWNVAKLLMVVPLHIAQKIIKTLINTDATDCQRWNGARDDKFSMKAAWELVRVANVRSQLFADFWCQALRPSISAFLWRLIKDFLPVDERLRRKGFVFASKC